jgi:hypothetical protein
VQSVLCWQHGLHTHAGGRARRGEPPCLPTCLESGGEPRYEPVLAGPHLAGKFRKSVTF